MRIQQFQRDHIPAARALALANYNEERAAVPILPLIEGIPDAAFEEYIDNELGVAMFEGGKMLGFLCCDDPWENAFNSTARGTFVPIHAHGAIPENRGYIYKRLYQAAAEIWVGKGIGYHTIGLYAHDAQTRDAFFSCGFGLRCVDAVRPLENFAHSVCEGIRFDELAQSDAAKIRDMRIALSVHLGESPCFMRASTSERESWIARAEARDSRLFTASDSGAPIAYIEVTEDGENFATWEEDMKNICGAYCLPAYRGKGIMQALLNYVITKLQAEDLHNLGVDFESFNLTSNGFWLKHFTAYTHSVTRRIDECAIAHRAAH
ncbi:MAG: GNAT family N-acetyltransferase [Clostridiales bacterium]|nr:GNAT family N-acetyltransferase [Clostridiales bacterium]